MNISQILNDLVENQGMKLSWIADNAGLDRGLISKLRKGTRKATPETIIKLAPVLKTPVITLMNIEGYISDQEIEMFSGKKYVVQSSQDIPPELDPLIKAIKENPEKAKAVAPFLRKILENYDNLPADISRLCDAVLSLSEAQRQGLMAMIGV